MSMLVHINNLSLWEIAHYWHGYDPRESTTHSLPLAVRDTLLVLAMSYEKKVNFRVPQDKAYVLEILKATPRFTARHYRQTLRKSIEKKVFGKRFYSNMFLSRSQLGRWCIRHNEPFPKFWFPDNQKYPFKAEGNILDEITGNGRYKVALLYDDTDQGSATPAHLEESVVTTVNENALKAAQASHAATNEVKERFILFYREGGDSFPSKKAAAEYFFDKQLSKREQLLFARRDSAVRTFLDRLRIDSKQS